MLVKDNRRRCSSSITLLRFSRAGIVSVTKIWSQARVAKNMTKSISVYPRSSLCLRKKFLRIVRAFLRTSSNSNEDLKSLDKIKVKWKSTMRPLEFIQALEGLITKLERQVSRTWSWTAKNKTWLHPGHNLARRDWLCNTLLITWKMGRIKWHQLWMMLWRVSTCHRPLKSWKHKIWILVDKITAASKRVILNYLAWRRLGR